jgi:hypothetical protein
VANSYTADGSEWTVRKKGNQFAVVLVDRATDTEKQTARFSPSATWAGRAAAREGYRQGRADAVEEIHRHLDQLLKGGDPGSLPEGTPDAD